MSSVKGTSACCKQSLYCVLVVTKQLGTSPYFLTLSWADLRWEQSLQTYINKLNKLRPSQNELENLSYQERFNFLNNNPLLLARNFQYNVEMLLMQHQLILLKMH